VLQNTNFNPLQALEFDPLPDLLSGKILTVKITADKAHHPPSISNPGPHAPETDKSAHHDPQTGTSAHNDEHIYMFPAV